MTNQEAFDKVYRHLLKQGRKSMTKHMGCMYRGPDGLMCAVGCLIPDECYDGGSMECEAASEIAWNVPALEGVDLNLLNSLQAVHDSQHPRSWKSGLASVASRYNLTVPEAP